MRELRARFIGASPVSAPVRDWRAETALVLAYPPLSQQVEPGSEEDQKEGVWLGWDTARTRDLLDPITSESAHGLLTRLNINLKAVVDAANQRVMAVYPDTYVPDEDDLRSLWGEQPIWRTYLRTP